MKEYLIPAACLKKMRNIGLRDAHVQLLYNVLLLPQIKNYLEIGCGQGVSTSAAAQALADRGPDDFHPAVCDVRFTPPVLELIGNGFQRFPGKSLSWLPQFAFGQWDCIFVDGDHSRENVAAEIVELHRLNVATVIAHDTANRTIRGPAQIVDAFPDYECFHDPRWLGFFVASRDPAAAEAIRVLWGEFEQWSRQAA